MILKKGQLGIFVMLALLIVAGVIVVAIVKEKEVSISEGEFAEVYAYYASCIEQKTKAALDLAGTQAGHLAPQRYEQGSEYAPLGNQLDFLGFSVPYWYTITGNGLAKEQVPLKREIEKDVENYLNEHLSACNFEPYTLQGYRVHLGKVHAKVTLEESRVRVRVMSKLDVAKDNSSALKEEFDTDVQSNFGTLYALAREIYDKEKKEAFLENYSADVLRLYAPVDGVEISCSPKIWKTREVVQNLKNALEANLAALRFGGQQKYFAVPLERGDAGVHARYAQHWPTKVEIVGSDDELMIAHPVGNQQGLGILGFCYAPYHFVYDIQIPVMFQLIQGDELFQFPIAVVLDKNIPRKGIFSEIQETEETEVCTFPTQEVAVRLFDTNLQQIDGDISYTCFDQQCPLGKTTKGVFVGKAPACLNGVLLARAEGHAEKKQLFSSNSETSTDIILDKEYEVNISVVVSEKPLTGTAIVAFEGSTTRSLSLPDASSIRLSEGLYNVSVTVYGNSSVSIPATTKTQCTQVAQSGLAGLFGATKEHCFEIKLPKTTIETALVGGGKGQHYLLASQLQTGKLTLNVDALPPATSLERLQLNYEAFERQGVDVV